jgi:hypothetical protein
MADSSVSGAGTYLYEHVPASLLLHDLRFSANAPKPGDRLPDFDLPTTSGIRFRSADVIGKKPLLLVTGSYTCPMTASSNPVLKALYQAFGDRIGFVMLHVREAHPGEHYDQARRVDEKLQHAQDLRMRDDLPWTIAIDTPDGQVHRLLDEKPNCAYLTDLDGTIVFRSLWVGDDGALRDALHAVAHGKVPRQRESQALIKPMAMGVGVLREVARQSGPRAQADLWRVAPPMALLGLIADLYRPLPPKWRGYAAIATAGLLAAALLTALSRARLRG